MEVGKWRKKGGAVRESEEREGQLWRMDIKMWRERSHYSDILLSAAAQPLSTGFNLSPWWLAARISGPLTTSAASFSSWHFQPVKKIPLIPAYLWSLMGKSCQMRQVDFFSWIVSSQKANISQSAGKQGTVSKAVWKVLRRTRCFTHTDT